MDLYQQQNIRQPQTEPKTTTLAEDLATDARNLVSQQKQLSGILDGGLNLSGKEYAMITTAMSQASDPNYVASRFAQALVHSKNTGISLDYAYQNLEALNKAQMGRDVEINPSGLKSIMNSFRIGKLANDKTKLSRQFRLLEEYGGDTSDVQQRIAAIEEEMASLQDDVPRNLFTQAVKLIGENWAYMGNIALKAAAYGGAAALIASGIGIPAGTAMLGTLAPAGASLGSILGMTAVYSAAATAGSFKGSADWSRDNMYYDLRAAGVDKNTAQWASGINSWVQGAIETFLGTTAQALGTVSGLSIGKLANGVATRLHLNGITRVIAAGVIEWAKGTAEEGLEELLQGIADNITKALAYEASGMDWKDADLESIGDLASEFAGGALMGGFLGIPSTVIRSTRYAKTLKNDAVRMDSKEAFIEKHMASDESSGFNVDLSEQEKRQFLSDIYDKNHNQQATTSADISDAQAKTITTDFVDINEEDPGTDENGDPVAKASELPVEPVKRLQNGRLRVQESKDYTVNSDGSESHKLKIGSVGSGTLYGTVEYTLDGKNITIDKVTSRIGYESIQEDAVKELMRRYEGYNISWNPETDAQQAIRNNLIKDNPLQNGQLNWFDGRTDIDAAVKASEYIQKIYPNMSKDEAIVSTQLLQIVAETQGQSTGEWIKDHIQNFKTIEQGISEGELSSESAKKRAATVFDESGVKAIIYTGKEADFSTFTHETFHVLVRTSQAAAQLASALREASHTSRFEKYVTRHPETIRMSLEDIQNAIDSMGDNPLEWTRAQHEVAAHLFESYLLEGRTFNERLQGLFQKIADWFCRIYNALRGRGILNDEIVKAYDEILAGNPELQKAASAETENSSDSGVHVSGENVQQTREVAQEERESAPEKDEDNGLGEDGNPLFQDEIRGKHLSESQKVALSVLKSGLNGKKLESLPLKVQDRINETLSKAKITITENSEGQTIIMAGNSEAMDIALEFVKKEDLMNKNSGYHGIITRTTQDKIASDKSLYKTRNNGFEDYCQFTAGANLKLLFENAVLTEDRNDRNNDPNIERIHIYSVIADFGEGDVGVVEILAKKIKGSIQDSIYTLEVNQIKKVDPKVWDKSEIIQLVPAINSNHNIAQQAEAVNSQEEYYQDERPGTPAFKNWFGDWENDPDNASKVVDENGKPQIVYHGTSRGDRIGEVFDPNRATSGPMAFFTDDRQIAEGYTHKSDTSMAYEPKFADFQSRHRFVPYEGGGDISITRAWYSLPDDRKKEIIERAKHVTKDWDGDNDRIIFDENHDRGLGNFDDYLLREHRGNAISALIDSWLESGELFREDESRFHEVLELSGVSDAIKEKFGSKIKYYDPYATDEKVFEVYLNIRKPFETQKMVTEQFVTRLENWYKRQPKWKYEKNSAYADLWDKNSVDIGRFAERLRDDIKNNTTLAWTSIPDFVSDYLKYKGFDGIKDAGGKYHEIGHTVWIPFESTQVKSATDNIGTFDKDNPSILFQDEKSSVEQEMISEAKYYDTVDEYMEFVKAMDETYGMDDDQLRDIWMRAHGMFQDAKPESVYVSPIGPNLSEDERDVAFRTVIQSDEGITAFVDKLRQVARVKLDADRSGVIGATTEEEFEALRDTIAVADEVRTQASPFIWAIAKGTKDLSDESIKKIRTTMDNEARAYRDLYARVMGDENFSASDFGAFVPDINEPGFRKWQASSIAERRRMAEDIEAQELADDIRSGREKYDGTAEKIMRLYDRQISELNERLSKLQGEYDLQRSRLNAAEKRAVASDEEIGRIRKAINREAARQRNKLDAGNRISTEEFKRLKSWEERLDLLNEEVKDIRKQDSVKATIEKREALAELKSKIREKEMARRQAKRVHDYKLNLANSIVTKPSASVNYEQAQRINAIAALVDPNFRRETVVIDGRRMTVEDLRTWAGSEANPLEFSPYMITRITKKSLNEWTVSELEEMALQVSKLLEEGRQIWQAKVDARAVQARSLQNQIIDNILSSKKYKKAGETPLPNSVESIRKEKVKSSGLNSLIMKTLNMDRKAQMLDNGMKGPAFDLLIREKRDAQNTEYRNKRNRIRPLEKLAKELGVRTKDLYETVPVSLEPGLTLKYTYSDLVYGLFAQKEQRNYMAFAYGDLVSQEEKMRLNHDNDLIQRLGDDRNKAFVQQAEMYLNEKPEIMRLAEAYEADLQAQAPRIHEVMVREYNQGLDVQNYYMPIYRKDFNGTDIAQKVQDDLFNRNAGKSATTPGKGFTKSRIDISPDHQMRTTMDFFSTWAKSMEDQEHLIANVEYVRKLNRVFKNIGSKDLQSTIEKTYGRAMKTDLDNYINEVANPVLYADTQEINSAIRVLRGGLYTAYLGFKTSGIVLQAITSPMPFLQEVGPVRLAKALLQMTFHPKTTWKYVTDLSPMMENRSMNPMIDEINRRVQDYSKSKGRRIYDAVQDFGTQGLEMIDRWAVTAGWLAVYEKELEKAEYQSDPEAMAKAARHADEVVYETQPTGDITELAPMFKSKSEFAKAFTQFQVSLNVIWNNYFYDMPKAFRAKEFRKAIGIFCGYTLAGALLTAVQDGFKGEDGDEPEAGDIARQLAYGATTQFTSGIPLLGSQIDNLMEALITGRKPFEYQNDLYPGINKILSGASSLVAGGDVGKALLKIGKGIGLQLGIPTSGISELKEMLLDDEWQFTFKPGALLGRRDY